MTCKSKEHVEAMKGYYAPFAQYSFREIGASLGSLTPRETSTLTCLFAASSHYFFSMYNKYENGRREFLSVIMHPTFVFGSILLYYHVLSRDTSCTTAYTKFISVYLYATLEVRYILLCRQLGRPHGYRVYVILLRGIYCCAGIQPWSITIERSTVG